MVAASSISSGAPPSAWENGFHAWGIGYFAQDAVVFERTYSASSLTMPSMASFFSGRTVREIGVGRDNRWNLPEEVDTLAELVAAGGTRTAAVVSNTVLRAPYVPEGAVVHAM